MTTKIKTTELLKVLSKYQLNGNIESVTFNVHDNELKCEFITDDKSLFGKVNAKGIPLQDGDYSLYSTSKVTSVLSVLSDELSITPVIMNGQVKLLNLKDDKNIKASLGLADPAVIPQPPKKFNKPAYETEFTFDSDNIQTFSKAFGALQSPSTFALIEKNGEVFISLNYNKSIQTDTIDIPISVLKKDVENPIHFSASYFKDILNSNKDAKTIDVSVSNKGLLTISFSYDTMETEYHLVATKVDGE